MKKFCEWITILLFVAVIFAVPILTIYMPKQTYSAYENRDLEKLPKYSAKSLLDGSYMENLETYYADHFVERDKLLEGYVAWQLHVLRKPVVNEVTMQGDTLLPDLGFDEKTNEFYKSSITNMTESLQKLDQTIKSYGGTFYYVGVPIQQSVLRDLYPSYMNNAGEFRDYLEHYFFTALQQRRIRYLDLYPYFSQKVKESDRYYSKVDHHYTFYGALETYQQIINAINQDRETLLTVLQESDLDFQTIDLPFYGSRSRKLYNQFQTTEKLTIANPKNPIPFERIDHGADVPNTVYTLPGKDDTYVTYDVYMGGDKGETVIRTNRPELPNVLIFGDSFTNPIESLLYYSFNEMHSLDLRIYQERTLTQYIESYQPDIVICVRDDTMYINSDGNGHFR